MACPSVLGWLQPSDSSDSHIICDGSTEVQRPRNYPAIKREKHLQGDTQSGDTLNLMVPLPFSHPFYHLSTHLNQKLAISKDQGMLIYTISHKWGSPRLSIGASTD